ncbi:MAG: hypothetical protein V4664_03380 [Patescibacteria group bacterium]
MKTPADNALPIQTGKIAAVISLRSIKAAVVTIKEKDGSQIEGYYHVSAFTYPRAGLLQPFFSEEEMKRPPNVGDIIAFVVEGDDEFTRRMAAMKTRTGREVATEADIQFQGKDKKKIVHACVLAQLQQVQREINERPVFRIYETPDSTNFLFEGSMQALEATEVAAFWDEGLTVKEFYRGDWVVCDGDPRIAYKNGDSLVGGENKHGDRQPVN